MATLSLYNVQPGMVLGQDITAPGGRLLLPAGTSVTPQHLHLLEQRGVTHVDVAENAAAADNASWSAAHQTRYHDLFRHHRAEHPLSRELMRLYRLRNGDPNAL